MIWSKVEIEPGTQMWKRKFAVFPTTMSDNSTIVWLQFYYQCIEYAPYGWDNKPYAWIVRQRMVLPGLM